MKSSLPGLRDVSRQMNPETGHRGARDISVRRFRNRKCNSTVNESSEKSATNLEISSASAPTFSARVRSPGSSDIANRRGRFDAQTDCNGKVCYKKRLVEFNKKELPCSQHEDLMASVQPSSHHEKSSSGLSVSNWFNSSPKAGCSVLVATLLLLLFVLFT